MVTGVTVIEYNKFSNNGPHFHSPHGILGILGAAWFLLQYFNGFTMLNTPALYGGERQAKSIWKYHRRAGYVLYFLIIVAVVGSGATSYVSANMFDVIPPLVLAIFIIIGVYSRVRKEKLGF